MIKVIFSVAALLVSTALSAQAVDECIVEIWEVAPGSADEKYKGSDDDDDTFYITVDSRENSEAIKVYYEEYDIVGYYIWHDESERVSKCSNAFNFGLGIGLKTLGKTDDWDEALEWILEDLMECDHVDIEEL